MCLTAPVCLTDSVVPSMLGRAAQQSSIYNCVARNCHDAEREHILDELLIWSAENSADMEDEIMRASVRFTIFAVVSVVVIGQVALWLFPAVVQAQNNYGAIAYSSSTGRYGYSYDFGSRAEAEDYAISQCGRSDCVVKVWFKNACGALAVGRRGALGWGWSGSRGSAENIALNECQSRTSGCSVSIGRARPADSFVRYAIAEEKAVSIGYA